MRGLFGVDLFLDFLIFQNYIYFVLKKLVRSCFINLCLKTDYFFAVEMLWSFLFVCFCLENKIKKNVFAIKTPTYIWVSVS